MNDFFSQPHCGISMCTNANSFEHILHFQSNVFYCHSAFLCITTLLLLFVLIIIIIMTIVDITTITMKLILVRLERWSIFCGDGMVMVLFSQRWNVDGFWEILTITIDGFWWDQPLATMVFRWFSNFEGPMVNDGYWRRKTHILGELAKKLKC